MPPIIEITKDKIVDAAFEIAREQGLDALTARNIAQKVKCSTQPIYSACGNMEEIKNETYHMAVDFALHSINKYENENNSPALNFAIGFLHFAKNEKHMFRTVYLSGHKKYDLSKDKFIGEEMMAAYMRHSKRLHTISESKLRKIYLRLSIYLIGIGTIMNSNLLELEINEAIEMVREMYETVLLSEGITNSKDGQKI